MEHSMDGMDAATGRLQVGIVGLGLIGGSLAKAYKAAGHQVYGLDLNRTIQDYAKLAGFIDEALSVEKMVVCDLILLAVYPEATIAFVKAHRRDFGKQTVVMDCCGVKQAICDACQPIAAAEGFTFVGGHPMAGTERSGIKVSRADLFQGASMVIVPPVFDDIRLLAHVKALLKPLGLGRVKVTKAAHHDRMIAYTSQLSHIASNAFVKSPSAVEEEGYSGGSFRDLTRVAYLNEAMWAELFMYNREPLLTELDILLDSLKAYRNAIATGDRDGLKTLLREGRERKEELEAKRR